MNKWFNLLVLAVFLFFAPATMAQKHGNVGHRSAGVRHSGSYSVRGGNSGHASRRLYTYNERHYFGPSHRYVGRDFRWVGAPWAVGSRFFVGRFWFNILEPWPAYWGPDCGYYIQYDGEVGGYFAYCPLYPNARVLVSVAF